MRHLSPAFIVTSLALAIASGSVFAQSSGAANTSAQSSSSPASNPGVTTAAGNAAANGNGERMAASNNNAPAANHNPAVTPTPLFELTSRQGAAKEAARRARGIEPRVYGIAPRTERDLTHQIPDDPVIRY